MTSLNSDLNLDEMGPVSSLELEQMIQNFDPTNQHLIGQTVLTSQVGQSPLLSSAALSPSTNTRPISADTDPYVEIVEQPKSRGLRFRYECEGRSAGSIPGERTSAEKKTFPTIKIHNYSGNAIVVVSCVTKEGAPHCKPHPHSLVGKDCKKGVCTVKVKETNVISFPHLGIQCAKKKDVENSLKTRKEINVDPFQTGFSHGSGNIDLNVVRLCFQVFLPDANGKITRVVPPVTSQVIHDKKSLNELVICRVDRSSGRARGGDEIFLLCEKINKDDIQVRFYEENFTSVVWEAFGDFGAGDVHRQYAIVFKTPAFREKLIDRPVEVQMQLRRPSDQEMSEPIPFTYMPEDPDPDRIEEKRKRKAASFAQHWNASPAGFLDHGRNPNTDVKESLRTKLKANRKIKEEGTPQQSVPMYSYDNLGMKTTMPANPMAVSEGMSINYRTADNTAMGNVIVSQQPTLANQYAGIKVNVGNPSGMDIDLSANNIVVAPVSAGFTAETVDLQMLQAYLQDHIQVEDGYTFQPMNSLSGDLLDPSSFDPAVAAMESVMADDVNTDPSTANNLASTAQEALRALDENT
ncbi:putative transcription factor p65 homolog isoform X2 [Gigantopelta aegis]|uniref:putative transcription factor p65 homolog isoform X2 n=1 Tax=Gigantopelta aegis TaxID=1735272 RepID=UPI001B88A5FA|nr:putative transcription factor p65 homolog isoform X2 [Gigantopelta aegis]